MYLLVYTILTGCRQTYRAWTNERKSKGIRRTKGSSTDKKGADREKGTRSAASLSPILNCMQGDRQGSDSPKRAQTPSDSSDEDGEINKTEEQYEDARAKQNAEIASFADFQRARITREMLSKYCLTPWFDKFVKGDCYSFLEFCDFC